MDTPPLAVCLRCQDDLFDASWHEKQAYKALRAGRAALVAEHLGAAIFHTRRANARVEGWRRDAFARHPGRPAA